MSEHSAKAVSIGSWVKVNELGTGDEDVFYIVPAHEVDLLDNRIAPDNPMGRALMGAKPGDEISVNAPKGVVKFAVVDVGRE